MAKKHVKTALASGLWGGLIGGASGTVSSMVGFDPLEKITAAIVVGAVIATILHSVLRK